MIARRGVVWPACRAGALAELAVLAPVVALYTLLRATGVVHGDAATVITAVVATVAAPAVGGAVAARRAPAAPLTNSAVASAIGTGAYVVFRAVDAVVRDQALSIGAVVTVIMLSVLVGVIGGLVAARVGRA